MNQLSRRPLAPMRPLAVSTVVGSGPKPAPGTLPVLLWGTLCLGLLLLSLAAPRTVDNLRTRTVDAIAPLLAVLRWPVDGATAQIDVAVDWLTLQQRAEKLEAENRTLRGWYREALALKAENDALRRLTVTPPQTVQRIATAPVIADPGGSFVRSVLVLAGRRDGVTRTQAALAAATGVDQAVIGRVVDTGERSSRVLLLTDLNTRVPVMLADSGLRAVLAGDNTDRPRLLHVADPAAVQRGQVLLTSGDGGIFPPGLPVGRIVGVQDNTIRVEPFADLTALNYVELIAAGPDGGSAIEPEFQNKRNLD